MGKLGDMAKKAKGMARKHPDKADKGVERTERTVDERTGNRYDSQTDKASDHVRRTYGGEGDQPR
ncbi:antitoxin [Streptomyces sp. TRM 70361]|uniref:antitoxin n=1 Tax=Streptomyces sp. TRM 70361 TaxID=3116553 RepID=UPI002E7B8135|nr:antitoxin [Streptomyces sp. TRM 70361]MEE1939917.1 antitoxin [Streptomyces sp. TRM 70361]